MARTGLNMVVIMLCWVCAAEAAIIRVPADHQTIQAAITVSEFGDTVLVADGTYSGDGNRDITYLGKAILVTSENGPRHTVIECGGTSSAPHRGFVFQSGESALSVLQGFTVCHGVTTGILPDQNGGGMLIKNSSPTITNCIFQDNTAEALFAGTGGGICCINSKPRINECLFLNNISHSNGGALACWQASAVILTKCLFQENAADSFGGAVCCASSTITVDSCIFRSNHAALVIAGEGGALYLRDGSQARVVNSQFLTNWSLGNGGAAYLTTAATLDLANCLLSTNSSGKYGGACYADSSSSLSVRYSTFFANSSAWRGGAVYTDTAQAIVSNSILWSDAPDALVAGQLPNPTAEYCDVMGGYPGAGNLNADPLFTLGYWGAFCLQQAPGAPKSPCVDAGSQASSAACFEANAGTVCLDQLSTKESGQPDLGLVDLGFHYPVGGPGIDFELALSSSLFRPGSHFNLIASITNSEDNALVGVPLVVVLDVYGWYFFHPSWASTFEYEPIHLEIGETGVDILDFIWPAEPSSQSGLYFYGGLLTHDLASLIGNVGIVEFGWAP